MSNQLLSFLNPAVAQDTTNSIKNLLQGLSQDSVRFYSIFNQSFGSGLNISVAETIKTQWANGDFSQIPTIAILDSGMNSALGAYASSTNQIYLSASLINSNQIALLTSVLLEEIGHFLDAQLNITDTAGDEGQLFSALVRSETLSAEQIAAIQTEDDTGIITVDGQTIAVEMAAPVVTTSGSISCTENGAATAIASILTVTDSDSTNLISATISGFQSGDVVGFIAQNGITGTYNSSTGILSLYGSSSVANYQTALSSITYSNSSNNPNTTARTISFVVNDGTVNSTAATRTINITAVNDAASFSAYNGDGKVTTAIGSSNDQGQSVTVQQFSF